MPSVNLFQNADDLESFAVNQTIFKSGDRGEAMYVVKEGIVELRINGKVVESLGPGGILGEMALIDGEPRSATAVAKTHCKLVPITARRFTFLVQQTPHFSLQVMRIMAERLRRMDHQV